MNATDLVSHFNVFLLEDDPTRVARLRRWLSGVSMKVAAQPDDLLRTVDPHTVVVCVSQSLIDEDEDEALIRRQILDRNPYRQLVLFASEVPSDIGYAQYYDATLSRPISKARFQETIETRLKYGMYSVLLQEFYTLNTRLITLQRTDGIEDPRAEERIKRRLQQIQNPLEQLNATIDHADMVELMKSITHHRQSLTEPLSTPRPIMPSKYRPDSCSHCGLSWEVDHGGALGNGCAKISSDVWKCTRCNKITRKPQSSNRHVVRW